MSVVVEWYKNVTKYSDPRTENWFLVASPGTLAIIVACYIYFCVSAGPRYMRDKKPYDLKHLMTFYNFIQILFSLRMFYEGLMGGWLFEYTFGCQLVDRSESPTAMRMARVVHFYFVCKLVELLDTVFFVLRKKNRQITFLHMYHHAMMPFVAWMGVRFFPGGHITLLGVVNSFIHVFMYTYYMLSAFGPGIQKYLWWKRYLTMMQIIQFCIIFVHNLQLLLMKDCTFPKVLNLLVCFNAMLFIYLFGSFYLKTYFKGLAQKSLTSNGIDPRTKLSMKNGTDVRAKVPEMNDTARSKSE